MVIQHNAAAANSSRQLGIISGLQASSTEKLSSGYKINRSADNAAGLSISEKMRKQIRGLDRGALNIEDGISYAQVADGALSEVHDMLQRINELAVQAANGTNSPTDRQHINDEVQALKTEMERVFQTTAFNDKKIWEETVTIDKNVVGQVKVQSTTIATPGSQTLQINNDTFGLLPASTPYRDPWTDYHTFDNSYSYYTIHADDDGINLSWSAFNGTSYRTKTITWNELRDNGFKFDVGDYFENKDSAGNAITDPAKQLVDANGDAKFDFSVALNVTAGATNDQIAAAINGTTMSQRLNSSTKFQDEGNTLSGSGLRLYSQSFVYAAAYADSVLAKDKGVSGYDFENPSDSFIEPVKNASGGNLTKIPNKGANLSTARNSTDGWEFAFQAAGLGKLTANPSQCSYYSNDTDVTLTPSVTPITATEADVIRSGRDANDENVFWELDYSTSPWPNPTEKHWYITTKHMSSGTGTLGDVMHTLTGSKGLLSKSIQNGSPTGNSGATDAGGHVYITFDITADTPYTYGKDAAGNDLTSDKVGTFTLAFDVTATDTEQSILDKLNAAFNDNTLFDLDFTNNNKTNGTVQSSGYNTSTMLKNDYLPEDRLVDIDLSIHSGDETTDKISLNYECLRLKTIGLADTNVLTQNSALDAIDEIAGALEIISAQRSMFGSYQNRMERAYNIDNNSSENAQHAESKIRDTDMAVEMVNYSKLHILGQAGQSMLAQSNQRNQGIMNLLN